ncbi:MAG TPA: OmpA family protein [Myxococcales bacterium]|nr:OmpA family protein [Myxococcales bacterium]
MLALLLLLAAGPEANLVLLRPASGSDGLLTVEGTRPLLPTDVPPLELQVGFDFQDLPVRAPGLRVGSRIGGWAQFSAQLGGEIALFAQMPLLWNETGDVSSGFAVGDVRVGVRRALQPGALSVQASIEAATAEPQTLTGDARVAGEALVAAERETGKVHLLANAYLRLRAPRDIGSARLGSELGLRLGAFATVLPRLRAYIELEVQASLRQVSQQAWPLEWRGGATMCATEALALDAAAGTRLDDGLGAPSLRGVLAVRYAPSFCRQPKQAQADAAIAEIAAAMAQERAAREQREHQEALLALFAPSEADARERMLQFEAADLVAASEADGLLRAARFAEEDRRDSDGDGIPDRLDNCPHEKGPAANHGCPVAKKQLVALREDRLDILDKIYFSTGKALIEKRSDRLLGQIAQVLQQHPDLLVDVEGHTDDQGSAVLNTALSQARAEAVAGWLVRHGVAARRLEAHGFGPSRPVASNETKGGRERNRRVEFHLRRRP